MANFTNAQPSQNIKFTTEVYLFDVTYSGNTKNIWIPAEVQTVFEKYFTVGQSSQEITSEVIINTYNTSNPDCTNNFLEIFKNQFFQTPTNMPSQIARSTRSITRRARRNNTNTDDDNNSMRDDYVHLLCRDTLNPAYVSESINHVFGHGGIIVKCYINDNMNKFHDLGFTLCYNRKSDVVGRTQTTAIRDYEDLALYISSICTPKNTPMITVQGIASRLLDSISEICQIHNKNYKYVRLDALLYCLKYPNPHSTSSRDANITQLDLDDDEKKIEINLCNLWLHDYYMSKNFLITKKDNNDDYNIYDKFSERHVLLKYYGNDPKRRDTSFNEKQINNSNNSRRLVPDNSEYKYNDPNDSETKLVPMEKCVRSTCIEMIENHSPAKRIRTK